MPAMHAKRLSPCGAVPERFKPQASRKAGDRP